MLKFETVYKDEAENKLGVLTSYFGASMVLKDEKGKELSGKYIGMIDLGDDHYAVSIIESHLNYLSNPSVETLNNGDYEIIDDIKWGIMRLTRDKKGRVIPYREVMVTPYIYNHIGPNNSKTATVSKDGFYTYVELDRENFNYGKELVPCVLTKATCFDIKYADFAEYEYNGVTGYLPRIKRGANILSTTELIEETEARELSKMPFRDRRIALYDLESKISQETLNRRLFR